MSRSMREEWGELYRFMARVKEKYPSSACILQDNRLFVDNKVHTYVSIRKGLRHMRIKNIEYG